MSLQLIELGATANNGLGDKLRIGGDKINDNFSEIYDKLISDNFVVVKTLADFPAPVSNSITLLNDTTYLVTSEIDTLGNSFILGNGSVIKGTSYINAKLYSSTPIIVAPFIQSSYDVNISNITISTGVYSTFTLGDNIIAGFPLIENILLENVLFDGCEQLGLILRTKKINILNCEFINCGSLNFLYEIQNINIDNCYFSVLSEGIFLNNTVVLSNKFNVSNSYFYATGTDFCINISPLAIIPTNGFTLLGNTFAGGSTDYIVDLIHSSSKAYFKNNTGIRNTSDTGFARYLDTTYTLASPLSINNGVTATLINNANNILSSQMPSDMTIMFNPSTQKIIAKNDGDAYTISIRFKAKISVINGYFDIKLNIGGTQGVISQESIIFSRDANTEQRFDIDLTVFSGSTFVSNGGTLQITPQNGNMQIYDISFVIVRTHKAQ